MKESSFHIKTTVIVPVYNTEKYLADCLNSLLHQTQRELQIIIVDDGSTDGSMEIAEEFKALFTNMMIIRGENKGVGAARNTGLHYAQGEYIYFLDSDDYIDNNTLELCYSQASAGNLDLVLFDAKTLVEENLDKNSTISEYDRTKIIKNTGYIYSGREFLAQYMEKELDIVSVCLMYLKRKFVTDHQLLFPEGLLHEDEGFRFFVMFAAERIQYIPKLLHNRRYRAGSIMTSPQQDKRLRDYISVVCKMIEKADAADRLEQKYIDRKLWQIFGRYEKLFCCKPFTDENRPYYDNICHLFQTYMDKFGGVIEDNEIIFYRYQWLSLSSRMDVGRNAGQRNSDIKQARDQAAKQILGQLPLNSGAQPTAIYGIGAHTDKLLKEYETLVGRISDKILFIDSNINSLSKQYHKFPVYNISDIAHLNIKNIIISSFFYEQQIYEKITEKYGNKYQIIRLYNKIPFTFFELLTIL